MKTLLSFVCLILSTFASAYALECPKAPEQIKKDWAVEVKAAVLRIGPVKGAELKVKTKEAAEDLLGKIPDAGKIYLEHMMFSSYCTALRDDKKLTEAEKAKLLKEYRRDVIPTIKKVTTKKSRKSAPTSQYNQSFVRFKYIICTGPYNMSEKALKYKDSNYLLKNNIFRILNENGAFEDGSGGVVSYKTLSDDEIDKVFGLKISKSKITVSQKVEMYKRYFKSINMDINLMYKLKLLPKFLANIKAANYRYNEPVRYEIYETGCPDNMAQLTFYFRSIRVKSVLIENISNKPINHIKLHVKEYATKNLLGLRIGGERLLQEHNWQDRLINFPIDFLRPNEGIILPLGVQLVSEKYASGYIYESDRDKRKIDVLSRDMTVRSEDIDIYKSKGVEKSLFSDNPEPIDISTSYEVTGVEFIVDGERTSRTYSRKLDKDNLIYVNDTCECGSCPVLLAENRDGSWRRLREMISENKAKINMNRFTYFIPSSAKKVKIEEFKSETSYFSHIGLSIKNSSGIYYEEIYNNINGALLSVTHDNPYVLDLSDMHEKYGNIDEISITGSGYYETKSSTICPPVLILDPKLF